MMSFSKPPFCIVDAHTTNPGDVDLSALETLVDLRVYDRTPRDAVVDRARGRVGVITNKVVLDREILEQLPDCRAIFLLSTGTNAVDLKAARERGIPVHNIPAYSTASVAEFTLACMLDWARSLSRHADSVREGEWARRPDFCYTITPQRELAGLTLGLVGFGEIARAVARVAQVLGMEILATTPHPEGKPDLGQRFVEPSELWRRSDLVSLHCPLTPDTERMVNADTLSRMQKGSVLINTGRGGLVDEAALEEALASGHLDAAYLDVLTEEPPAADAPLLKAPRVRITPHIAWATRAARQRLVHILAENVEAWMKHSPRNVVNGV